MSFGIENFELIPHRVMNYLPFAKSIAAIQVYWLDYGFEEQS